MPEPAEQSPSLALRHYLTVLRRRWRVVAIVLVLGLLAAAAYLKLVQQQVTATTLVDVNVISTEPFNTARSASDLLDAATEQQIATSSAVAEIAADSISDDATPKEVRSGLTASLAPDGTVMRISYTADDSATAREGADAVADAYLSYRTDRADDRKKGTIGNLDDRLDDLRDELRVANRRLDRSTPGTSQYTQADSDRQLVSIEIDGIVTQISQTEQIDTESGTVLTSATENAVTYQPRTYLVLATGALAGLALGLVVAFVVNTLDRRVRDRYDVEGAGAGQILSRLGARSATVPATGGDLDALRVARERLLAGPQRRVVALIDRTHGPAPCDVPVNLAIALAETARRVEVILPETPTDFVAELRRALDLRSLRDDDAGETLGARRIGGLEVHLPHPDESEIEADTTGAVRGAIGEHGDEDRFTVLALPPSASAAGRLAAGRVADAVVMVIEDGSTRIDDIAQVVSEAREVGSQVVGVIVVPSGRASEARATGPFDAEPASKPPSWARS